MAQVTTGIRGLLSSPLLYEALQSLLGANRYRRILTREYILKDQPETILDIGCGPCDVLKYIPDNVAYVGVDSSQSYIDAAVERFGDRARFICLPVDQINADHLPPASRVIAMGLLHHLDDEEVTGLCRTARTLLEPGGRFITIDPTFIDKQNPIARLLISNDRGQNVRTPDAYRALACEVFPRVDVDVRHDLLTVPYTHTVMVCSAD